MNRLAAVASSMVLAAAVPAQGRNLLFYGNSYTYYSWGYGVPELVQQIATAAGHATPTIVRGHVGGATLQYHATDPGQIALIGTSLPPGQTWTDVVLQASELEATDEGGFRSAAFRSHAVTIATNVRNHSPAARAVMYQTWARAWGHANYPIPWAGPMEMHREVRQNYRLAVGDILAAHGSGSATLAAAGDCLALLEWDPVWYEADLNHPSPKMILLAAMCICTSIYGQTVCAVEPVFSPPDQLAQNLASQGIGQADWKFLSGIADLCAAPAVRPFAGSGDHLLLETATGPGPVLACPRNRMTVGTLVQLRLRSMNGVYHSASGWLLVDLFATGAPPGPSLSYPELHDGGSMSILATAATLANPLGYSIPMPVTLLGSSVLVQGLAWQSSFETGNPWFTTTDGHELVFF